MGFDTGIKRERERKREREGGYTLLPKGYQKYIYNIYNIYSRVIIFTKCCHIITLEMFTVTVQDVFGDANGNQKYARMKTLPLEYKRSIHQTVCKIEICIGI